MFDERLSVKNIVSVVLYKGTSFPLYSSYNPSLKYCELIFLLSGESIVTFAGKQITEKYGTVRFLPKGSQLENAEYTVERIESGVCIDIYFDTDYDVSSEMLSADFSNNPTVKNLFLQIQKLWYAKHGGYYHKCMALLYEIFAEIGKTNSTYLPKEKYRIIEPAIEYIENNFLSGNIDCNYLSGLCGVSYSYFKKLFIMKFGISPIKYITKKKIMYACDLLITNKYSVSEIADITGYENVYYFSRVFKENTGMTPTEYRKKA